MRQVKDIESGNFIFRGTSIKDVLVIDVKSYLDARGSFMETYKKEDFIRGGITCDFVQDNQSINMKGGLRGLPF